MKKNSIVVLLIGLVLMGCATTLGLKETRTGDYSRLSPVDTVQNPNMVLIEAGTFMFRADDTTKGVETNVDSFYISKYEVTVGEFRKFIDSTGYVPTGETYGYEVLLQTTPGKRNPEAKNPSWDNPYMQQDENHPVVLVSWYDAVEYCNWLSLQEGLAPAYKIEYVKNKAYVEWNRNANGYRLPTEAEWEYACRAGSTTLYYYGDTPDLNTGWYFENSDKVTHPVGTMLPNKWGLYDMQGNVAELTQDTYPNANVKIHRGSDYLTPVKYYGQSNIRFGLTLVQGWNHLGFRIVRR